MSSIVKIFNEQYTEFLDEVLILFPNNTDLKTGKTFCLTAIKANPLFIIKLWQSTVLPYYDKINNFDFDFFDGFFAFLKKIWFFWWWIIQSYTTASFHDQTNKANTVVRHNAKIQNVLW